MIPYDDLVAALSAWRARQGLPVSTMGGGSAAAPVPGSGPHAQPGSGPYGQSYGQPGSGPNRGAPPAPPRGNKPSVPPPVAVAEELHEVDDAEMIEEHYEAEGSDFAMSFGEGGDGSAPERPTDQEISKGNGRSGGRGGRDDW